MNGKSFFPWGEGRPTKPEVDALLAAYPPEGMKTGWHATDDELINVIGPCEPVRYHTVCMAWIRRLECDYSVILYRAKQHGYFVPTADEVFARTHPALQHIGRTARKQKRHVATIPAETQTDKVVQNHQGQLLTNIERETRKARQNLLPPNSPPTLPQLARK
jgi:hypothetical protein